ncbi:translocation/assembly module TamB domain-containing protein [Estrella lausannensis]|uniref:Conserved putative secreted protein n=1 Tax=Estrella lausannensis TaxID=483423 RepID=A0A0H5E4I7_9BACT|nr:translocation/assembly module TamB domain-containing protein [Estrella lausannensis]CRX38125.1 Conserved putative secreted protein [Estrella lausannensis]
MYLKSVRIFFLIVILAILAALAAMQMPQVKELAIRKGVEWLSNRIGYDLQVGDVELMLPFEVIIKKPVILTPKKKAVFESESVTIRVNPYSFITREVHLHSLVIEKPRFKTGGAGARIGIREFEKYLPPLAISINHLQLTNFEPDKELKNYLDAGLYSIDAKFEYEPEEGYAFINVKVWNEESPDDSLNASAALFADDEIGFVGFEAFKTRGVLKGPAGNTIARVTGNLSGTEAEWLRFVADPAGFDNYTLDGQIRASWNYFGKDEEGKLSTIKGGTSSSMRIGGKKWAEFTDLEITTPFLHLQSNLSIGQDLALEGTHGTITFNDAGEILQLLGVQNDLEAKGAAVAQFSIGGSKEAPSAKVRIQAEAFEILAKKIEKIESTLEFVTSDALFTGDLEINISDQNEKYYSTVHFKTDLDTVLELEKAAIELPWGQGELDLLVGKKGVIRSRAKADIADLAFLTTILNKKVEGSAKADLFFFVDESGLATIALKVSSDKITMDNFNASALEIMLDADECPDRIFCGGEAKIGSLDLFNEKLTELQLVFERKDIGDAIPYLLSLEYNDQPVKASGFLSVEKLQKMKIGVNQLDTSLKALEVHLKEPFVVSAEWGSFETTPLFLNIGKGSLFASADMHEDSWHFSLRFKEIPCGLFPFEEIFDQHLEGDAEGEAFLYGTFDQLEGQVKLDVHDLFATEDAHKKIPLLKGSLAASFIENRMEMRGEVSGIGDAPLHVEAALPLSLGLKAPYYRLDMDAPMKARIEAEGALTPLLELFIVDAASFSGNGKIEMEAEGSINSPKIHGAFILSSGLFEIAELGTHLTGIRAEIKGEGDMLYLNSLEAGDGGSGTITGSGKMRLSLKDNFPFQVDLALSRAKPVHVNLFDGEANGFLTCTGTIDKAHLQGALSIQNGRLLLPRKIPETSVSYPVRYVNQADAKIKPTELAADSGIDFPLDVDIELSIQDSFAIVDEDLQSTWRGKVNVTGPALKPNFIGEVKLIGGDYLLNGKQFSLSQGRIAFNGDFEKKSSLYVSLSRDIQNYQVEIILKGPLKDPEILLRSRPSLPTQQVLSLILFGRTASDINELQEEQLEQSLSNLTNSDKKDDTLTKFQKTLGIDHIEFMRSNDSSQQVCIKVGKYISRNVYLSVSRDSAEEVNAISLEAQIQKNIKAQIEAQDNAQGQFSIFWKKNY